MNLNKQYSDYDFKKDLEQFLKKKGIKPLNCPVVYGNILDLFKLYDIVSQKGGSEVVTNKRLWRMVADEYGLPQSCVYGSYRLKKNYYKFLKDFEEYNMIISQNTLDSTNRTLCKTSGDSKNFDSLLAKRSTNFNIEDNSMVQVEKPSSSFRSSFPTIKKKNKISDKNNELDDNTMKNELKLHKKRIITAFNTKIRSEIRYALNYLYIYSYTKSKCLYLDDWEIIFKFFSQYVSYAYNKLEDSNYFMNINEITIEYLTTKHNVNSAHQKNTYNSFIDFLEELKISLTIINNFLMFKTDGFKLLNDKSLVLTIIAIFVYNNDKDLNDLSLRIVPKMFKSIKLDPENKKLNNHMIKKLALMIYLNDNDKIKLALKSSIILLSNEVYFLLFKDKINLYIEGLLKLLLSDSTSTINKVLVILCSFSNIKTFPDALLGRQNCLFTRLIIILLYSIENRKDNIAHKCLNIIRNLLRYKNMKDNFSLTKNDILLIYTNSNLL